MNIIFVKKSIKILTNREKEEIKQRLEKKN
jgi:hypothetical protein